MQIIYELEENLESNYVAVVLSSTKKLSDSHSQSIQNIYVSAKLCVGFAIFRTKRKIIIKFMNIIRNDSNVSWNA